MAPLFIQRSRQRAAEAQETFPEEPATSLPPRSRNPFMMAADDLAAQWEDMRQERDTLRDEAEQLRGHNVYLSERVDSLSRELATRIEFFDLEIDRIQKQRDSAVDQNVDRRAKLEIIAKALMMVLNETLAAAPMKREPTERIENVPRVRDILQEHTHQGHVHGGPTRAPSERNLSTVQRPVRDFAQTPPEGHDVSEADAEDARDLINRLAPVELKR